MRAASWGRDAEAVEAGLLSVKLGELLPPGPQQVNLFNYLGVAYLWAKSFGDAEEALREAERLALLYAPDSNVLLPRINLAWLEAVRLFNERYFNGVLPDTRTLEQRLALCAGLFDDDAPFPGLPGVRAILQRFGRCAHALAHCWRGEPDTAQQWLDAAQDPLLADSLNSRHKVVQTHLDIRTSERNLRLLGYPRPGAGTPVVRGFADRHRQPPPLRGATVGLDDGGAEFAASHLRGTDRPGQLQAHQRHVFA